MNIGALPRPGLAFGPYPQRQDPAPALWLAWADRLGQQLTQPSSFWPGQRRREDARFVAAVQAALPGYQAAPDLAAPAATLRAELLRHGLTPALLQRCLALAATAVQRATGLAPHAPQLLAARAMLAQQLVEMDTGEGKSLALLMAAATAALAGVPVHVVTANDYLAQRDAEQCARVLAPLGLRAAAITTALDATQRRAAYAADVAYCTARELGFDYLRDQLQQGRSDAPPVLRGLNLALIDEADSVLIDQAGTPLVIAVPAPSGLDENLLRAMWLFSASLAEGGDYRLDTGTHQVLMTDSALVRLRAWAHTHDERAAHDLRPAAELLRHALWVRHGLRRDHDYLVQAENGDDAIVLLDASTGRTLPGTRWSRGIQQLVALKEGCTLPPATRTVEQITVQGLFERYWRLGGASGTLRESRFELFAFYRLGVTRVQPRVPSQRLDRGVRLLPDEAARTQAVIARARECAERGQPLLVGTLSVAACDALAQALRDAGFQPAVLHAREDGTEAELVTCAGAPGALTVATHMAGRGTDIAVHPAAQAAGGLQVLACALNPSRRVLRQLLGRTARQGAPGGVETLLAVNCDTLQGLLPRAACRALATIAAHSMAKPGAGARWLARTLQHVTQELLTWRDFRRRWQLVVQTRRSRELLARARGAV